MKTETLKAARAWWWSRNLCDRSRGCQEREVMSWTTKKQKARGWEERKSVGGGGGGEMYSTTVSVDGSR